MLAGSAPLGLLILRTGGRDVFQPGSRVAELLWLSASQKCKRDGHAEDDEAGCDRRGVHEPPLFRRA